MHSPTLPVREVRCSSVGPQRLLAGPLPLAFQAARNHRVWLGKYCSIPCMGLRFQLEQSKAFVEGGLYVHRLVCSFGAGLAGGVLGLPCIQRSDSYSVAVRGSLADCPFFPA
jgi:hypothetical protein